jgi:hypothetical protein
VTCLRVKAGRRPAAPEQFFAWRCLVRVEAWLSNPNEIGLGWQVPVTHCGRDLATSVAGPSLANAVRSSRETSAGELRLDDSSEREPVKPPSRRSRLAAPQFPPSRGFFLQGLPRELFEPDPSTECN